MYSTADVLLLVLLGVNTAVISNFDTTLDHSGCMNAFQTAGIYILAYLASDTVSVTIGWDGYASWNDDVYAYYTAVVDAVAPFPNLLGFIVDTVADIGPDPTVVWH